MSSTRRKRRRLYAGQPCHAYVRDASTQFTAQVHKFASSEECEDWLIRMFCRGEFKRIEETGELASQIIVDGDLRFVIANYNQPGPTLDDKSGLDR